MLISEVPAFREYWYPIAYDHEIGTEPYPFRMFGDDYVAWRAEPGAPVHAAVDELQRQVLAAPTRRIGAVER